MIKRIGAAFVSLLAAFALASVAPAGVATAANVAPSVDHSIGVVKPPKPDAKRDKPMQAKAAWLPDVAEKGHAPVPPALDAKRSACSPPCYKYAAQYRNSTNITGASANASVITSSVDQVDAHSLWEITVENGNDIIEFGVTRDRNLNGDTYPALTTHLFGSVWYDNGGTRTFCGYNSGCGWTDYGSNATNLGSDVSMDNNVRKTFLITYDSSTQVWWVAYDGNWVAYVPATLGHSRSFTSGVKIQTFDEIAANHDPTCTDMGNSWLADNTKTFPQTGQEVFSLNQSTSGGAFTLATYSGSIVSLPAKWAISTVSTSSYYSGGPGYSPNPGACP